MLSCILKQHISSWKFRWTCGRPALQISFHQNILAIILSSIINVTCWTANRNPNNRINWMLCSRVTSPTWITDNLSKVTQHLEPQLIKATFFFPLLSGISINFSGEWSSSRLIFSRTLNISVLVFVIGINNQTWAYSPAAKYISYFFQTELKYTCLVLGHNTNCELWYTCLISWYPQWHGQKKKRETGDQKFLLVYLGI